MSVWRSRVEDALADEIGMLAPMVIDEVLQDMGISERQLSAHHGGKFIKILQLKTKNDMNNPQLIRKIYQIILSLPY